MNKTFQREVRSLSELKQCFGLSGQEKEKFKVKEIQECLLKLDTRF